MKGHFRFRFLKKKLTETMASKLLLTIIGILCCSHVVHTELFFTGGVVAVGSAITAGFMAGFNTFSCLVKECCNNRWINPNFTDLHLTLISKVYGQHLVIDPVVKHLKAHHKGSPSKALALSFHGGTGTGKNYVSRMVAEKLFKNGMKSKFVHLISATKEYPHPEMVVFYKDKLREFIEKKVKECPHSLFIFDEMDKMPPGLIDTLKPYLDFYEELGGVDYRKATFFFLSNTAGNDIAEKTVSYWKDGKKREDITLKEMEEIIRLPALNSQNGLWHSELIMKNLITAYIPFLPLERRHIGQCIKDGLVSKGYYKHEKEISEVIVQQIADELVYYPKGLSVFSTTGCKRIHEKIDYVKQEL